MTLHPCITTISQGSLETFPDACKRTITPLRERIGFDTPEAPKAHDGNQFIWTMGCDGPESRGSLDKAFIEHPERQAMDPDPARFIAPDGELSCSKSRLQYVDCTPVSPTIESEKSCVKITLTAGP